MSIMLFAALMATAHAGTLYVNGVRADGLRDFEFKSVTVRVDAEGNVWVDAPQYRIEVQGTPEPVVPPAATTAEARPTDDVTRVPSSESAVAPQGRYWLVTEDNASAGHTVDVVVNGNLVHKIQSGDGQVILDLGRYLKSGSNTIIFNALPTSSLDGGALFVYVGTGSNNAGTLELDDPLITYARRSTDAPSGASRSFQLDVP